MIENLKDNLITLDSFTDLRQNIGFHFTPKRNVQSILQTGLQPAIGDNSSGGFAKESIEKTFISYGLEGVLQLYNRLLNIPADGLRVGHFYNSISHLPYIPISAQTKSHSKTLSLIEGFEFFRLYMEDNSYFVFTTPVTQYERELSQEDIDKINITLSKLTLPNSNQTVKSKIEELDDEIDTLSEKSCIDKQKLLSLHNQRKNLAILLRQITKQELDKKRGKLINDNDGPIIEQVDFNDDSLLWYDQFVHPHNTHTRVVEDSNGLHGVRITKDMIKLFSVDGQTQANGLDFLQSMLTKTKDSDTLSLSFDCPLLIKFSEYINIVEQYKTMGLLSLQPTTTYSVGNKSVTTPERYVMDLTNLDQYPNLQNFVSELECFYKNNHPRKNVQALAKETITWPIQTIDEAENIIKQSENNTIIPELIQI